MSNEEQKEVRDMRGQMSKIMDIVDALAKRKEISAKEKKELDEEDLAMQDIQGITLEQAGPSQSEKSRAITIRINKLSGNTKEMVTTVEVQSKPRGDSHFDSTHISYKKLYEKLLEARDVAPRYVKTWQPPYPNWYDINVRCEYHAKSQGHSIKNCTVFNHRVQHLLDHGILEFEIKDQPSLVTDGPIRLIPKVLNVRVSVGHPERRMFVEFENVEDYSRVLTDYPWMIYGSYLTVQPWEQNIGEIQINAKENPNIKEHKSKLGIGNHIAISIQEKDYNGNQTSRWNFKKKPSHISQITNKENLAPPDNNSPTTNQTQVVKQNNQNQLQAIDQRGKEQPNIITLMETHVSGSKADKIIKDMGYNSSFRVEAQGHSGGIWMLWDNSVEVKILNVSNQYIHVGFRCNNRKCWEYLTAVYASPNPNIIRGDFNCILRVEERIGGSNRKNFSGLKGRDVNGLLMEILKKHVKEFYENLFTRDILSNQNLDDQNLFPELNKDHWDCLDKPIENSEIKEALFSMGPLKAPGLDGFHATFYQTNWDTVGEKVCQLVKQCINEGQLIEGINRTSLVLIPKVDNPETINQFRPINLCQVIYKIITKVIVNRLKPMLPTVISNSQTSFIPGRMITDNIILAQEVVHSMKKKKGMKGWIAIKIDLEKAYDRLDWNFIKNTMEKLGLPNRIMGAIMNCISSTTIQINWNGGLTEPFKPSRGIRQGDPLSPYLFVICIERLAQEIKLAVEKGNWKPIKLSKNGQKVNLQKSSIYYSNNVDAQTRNSFTNKLKIKEVENLGIYLGVPILHNQINRNTYSSIIQRVKDILTEWKAKTLSLA
ncbi:hypothetical protein F3Y22_tig00113725pilonHSYRG00162 [Hibiscus syriacus]|uniref:Reverse transcriptase domain-containing protein n=1 Tax=Hibiscus syriacus TaxID=106335 RepID=A0A6A2WMG1_HIBSY|nr:hypothetical protein F3Y22_tig00113725pilonHSYRG00162 [Hibiscus syriacus]